MGGSLGKQLDAIKPRIDGFGDTFSAATIKAAEGIKKDIAALAEMKAAIGEATAASAGLAKARAASAANGAAEIRTIKTGAAAQAKSSNDQFRAFRTKMRIRERSLRLERIEADRRVREEEKLLSADEKRQRAEMRHLEKVRRERDAMKRDAMRSGRHTYGHARHAVRSINHPAFESIGHATALGAAFGAGAAAKILESSIDIDTAAAKYRMFAVPDGVDPTKATTDAVRQAKLDSIRLGMDASTLLDMQAKAVKDGISPAIAKTLQGSIAAAANVMGGDPERLTDTLSEGIQQGLSMGLMKDAKDVRRFLNLEAGLSNYAGNSPEKMEQFISSGGIGRGKELGLDLTDTMAYGALLNSSGMRTGQMTSRFLGQLSQSIPKMYDRFREATRSRKNTEEDRAVRSAPSALGYGSVRQMQAAIIAGPQGLVDFATRLDTLSEKQRKLIIEGYGFSEQGGAALAEIGASPAKAKGVIARAKQLAEQEQAQDYLSEKFAAWQTSLASMLSQIEAGWRAIESELGDALKDDVIAPVRDWWTGVSAQILGSGLKEAAHRSIRAFVNGLGFDDLKQMLDSLSAHVSGFDPSSFFRGLGSGIRTVIEDLRSLGGAIGWIGGGDNAEAMGRFGAEMFGLSIALHVMSPVVTLIGGIADALLALRAAVTGVSIASKLMGITSAVEGLGAAAGVGMAGAIIPVSIAALAVGALAVTVCNIGEIVEGIRDVFGSWFGGGTSNGFSRFVLDKAKQAAGSDPSAQREWIKQYRPRDYGNIYNADGSLKDLSDKPSKPEEMPSQTKRWLDQRGGVFSPSYHPSSFDGGDVGLFYQVSYQPSDSADIALDAMTGTERGTWEIKASVDRLAEKIGAIGGLGASGGDSGGAGDFGSGSGRPNMRFGRSGGGGSPALPSMRYGHNPDGSYRVTPHGGKAGEFGPHVSLGKMGAKFAAKAPVIMDGLMKKYGLTREQAAGIVGNLGHESAGFTAYHEGGQAPGSGGVGWAQWTGSRRRAFEAWTKAHGLDPTSDEASWRYLTEGDPETAKAILAVKRTNNRRDATRAWHDSFERSADISHGVIVKPKSWNSRLNYADKAFSMSEKNPGGATVAGDKPLGSPGNPATAARQSR